LKTIKTQDTTLLKNISQNIHLCHTLPKPQKSAFVSGLLSAVVPGLGKMYVGQKKEGITAFLTVVPLGLLVFENVYKTGWNKPQTIVVSGLFSIFYIGNIFGSIYSSKAYYQNQNEKFNNEIFSNLYFPLRRVCKP
jgi:TM2 domain-containing membrane protein YozV